MSGHSKWSTIKRKKMPDVGIEPTAIGLKVQRSTTELTRHIPTPPD